MRVSARFLDVLNYLSATDSYDGARSYEVYDGRHRGENNYAQQQDSQRKPAVPFQVIKRRAVQRRFLAHLQHQTVVTVGSFVERHLPLGSLIHQPTFASGRVSSSRGKVREKTWETSLTQRDIPENGETTGRGRTLYSHCLCERAPASAQRTASTSKVFTRSFRDETRSDSTPGVFAGHGNASWCQTSCDTFVNIDTHEHLPSVGRPAGGQIRPLGTPWGLICEFGEHILIDRGKGEPVSREKGHATQM